MDPLELSDGREAIIYEPNVANPDKAYINSQLRILCEGTELNYEYAFASMMDTKNHTLVIKQTTYSIDRRSTRSMSKIIGFVTYSINNHYNDCIAGYVMNKANTELLVEFLKSPEYIKFGSLGCIAIDVIVTGQGAKGLGSLLLKHFNKKHNVFLKSVNTAYWFYIKQGFKHFYKVEQGNKYIELPYKSCNGTHFIKYLNDNDRECPDPNLNPNNFQSWYKKEEGELPDDDDELIPMILPTTHQAGGASNKSSEYITILGRRRKIVMQGRKKMVMFSGALISLSDAKKKQ
jgi:hypothetical protein